MTIRSPFNRDADIFGRPLQYQGYADEAETALALLEQRRPAARAFDPADWYTYGSGQFKFGGPGEASYYYPEPVAPGTGPAGQAYPLQLAFDPVIPVWGQSIGGPQQFYDWWQSFGPEGPSPAIIADLQQQARTKQEREAGRAEGISTLQGRREDVAASLAGWQDDPERAAIAAALRERAGGDLFTEREQAAADLELARGGALAANLAATQAAARGVAGGGLANQRQTMLDAITSGKSLELGAMFDRANREARARAEADLESFISRDAQVTFEYQKLLSGLDTQIAQMQQDVDIPVTDYLGYEALYRAVDIYEQEAEERRENRELYQQETAYGLEDFFGQLFDFLNAGGGEMFAALLPGI